MAREGPGVNRKLTRPSKNLPPILLSYILVPIADPWVLSQVVKNAGVTPAGIVILEPVTSQLYVLQQVSYPLCLNFPFSEMGIIIVLPYGVAVMWGFKELIRIKLLA